MVKRKGIVPRGTIPFVFFMVRLLPTHKYQ